MIFIAVSLLIGILIGVYIPLEIPKAYTLYTGVALLAAIDSVFGGINAQLHKTFNIKIFLSGFFGNAAIAAMITYIGTRLGMDLYIAAVVVFGSRLFQNFASMRRFWLIDRAKNVEADKPKAGPDGHTKDK